VALTLIFWQVPARAEVRRDSVPAPRSPVLLADVAVPIGRLVVAAVAALLAV